MTRTQARQAAAQLSQEDSTAFVVYDFCTDEYIAMSLPNLQNSPEIKIEEILEVYEDGELDARYD